MSTTHAFFSQAAALIHGSSVYRKESGSRVNVTRLSDVKETGGFFKYTEKYVGQVIREEDGGCVGTLVRVDDITSNIMGTGGRRRAETEGAQLEKQQKQSWDNEGGAGAK
jgi:hypothetical protein